MPGKLHDTPPAPAPDSEFGVFLRWIWDWITRRGKLLDVPGVVTWDYTANGIKPNLAAKPGVATTSTGGGMNYRGQWTAAPASPYVEFDVVLILIGAAAGTYISVVDNNTNAPDTGIGWVQIAPGDTVGRWS